MSDKNIGTWTSPDGSMTIVLANVLMAWWAREDRSGGGSVSLRTGAGRATHFYIRMIGGDLVTFSFLDNRPDDEPERWKETAKLFLLALNFYWETRS